MLALLLMAGRSKRFWPLADKCLQSVAGKTLLEHQVNRLRDGGVREVILVGGKHNLAEAKKLLPNLKTIEQKDPELGMRGALFSALPKIGEKSVLIVSANDFVDPTAYQSVASRLKNSKADGVLLARKVKDYFPGGYLTLRGKRIASIVEKPVRGEEPSTLVNIVVHAHRSAQLLLKALKSVSPKRDDGYELALDHLFSTHRYEAVSYSRGWQPVKYPWHLLPLLSTLLQEIQKPIIHPSAQIHPTAVIEGLVVIGRGVNIFPHATVKGPCFIGEGTVIANNSLVRESSIGAHCVIGYSTEVARSVIGDHVWTHSSYIGDSVIGNNVAFGGGTMVGNLRLDEAEISSTVDKDMIPAGLKKFGCIVGDDVRIGINVSLMPGIKIGAGSFVNSATLVSSDIPDRSFVKGMEGKLSIRPNRTPPLKQEDRVRFRRLL